MFKKLYFFVSILISLFVIQNIGIFNTFAVSSEWQPKKRIEYAVHCSPGCGNDQVARAMTKALSDNKILPVPIQVVNHAGGSGAVQQAWLFQRKGDEHILSSFSPSWLTVPLKTGSGFTWDNYTLIANLVVDNFVLVVPSNSPYKNLKEYLTAAKERPGKVSLCGNFSGGMDHFLRNLLCDVANVDIKYLALGDQVVPQVLGGHVDALINNPTEVMNLVNAGKMRYLAIFSDERIDTFPDAPTAKEQGYDVELYAYRGVIAPGGMPDDVADYYSQILKKGSEKKGFQDFVKNSGGTPKYMDRKTFYNYVSKQAPRLKEFMVKHNLIKKKK